MTLLNLVAILVSTLITLTNCLACYVGYKFETTIPMTKPQHVYMLLTPTVMTNSLTKYTTMKRSTEGVLFESIMDAYTRVGKCDGHN